MFVYGGPGNNTVNNAWSWMNYFWFQYLVKQGFVVISVDNRGTGYDLIFDAVVKFDIYGFC